jgi:hypothetical protein
MSCTCAEQENLHEQEKTGYLDMYISTCTGTCTCLKISALGLEWFFLIRYNLNSDEMIARLILKS